MRDASATPGTGPSGTEGYAAEADSLVRQYESIAFADVHRGFEDLFPTPPARVLDIGAGTGRDAAGFAASGYRVTAVEPTTELRRRAIELHASPQIEWLDDCLPELAIVSARGETFDIVMLTAVWMHLDEAQRLRAMPRVAALVAPGGVTMLSLRHGPVPSGRRMFDVTAEDTMTLAHAEGLICIRQRLAVYGVLNRPGVSWDRLAFERPKTGRLGQAASQEEVMSNDTELVQQLYSGFNARNIHDVLAALAENVKWANGMDGGHVHGREAVRAYWTEQWATISPHVEPKQISRQPDGSTAVEVHQVVHDLNGALLLDETVRHVFRIEGGKVKRFDIESASQLSSIVHGT